MAASNESVRASMTAIRSLGGMNAMRCRIRAAQYNWLWFHTWVRFRFRPKRKKIEQASQHIWCRPNVNSTSIHFSHRRNSFRNGRFTEFFPICSYRIACDNFNQKKIILLKFRELDSGSFSQIFLEKFCDFKQINDKFCHLSYIRWILNGSRVFKFFFSERFIKVKFE